MTCKCGSNRIIHINAKSSDLNFISFGEEEHDGYVPDHIGVGGGDYIDFAYCADCGCIQDNAFPLPSDLRLNEDEDDDYDDEYNDYND